MKEGGLEKPNPAPIEASQPDAQAPEKKSARITRREAMRLALSAAIASAVCTQRSEAAPGYEGTKLLEGDEKFFQSLIHDLVALRAFQEDPKMLDIESVVRVLAKTDIGWTEKLRQSDYFHPGASELFDTQQRFRGNGTTVRIRDTGPDASPLGFSYFMVTAKHVADVAQSPSGEPWIEHPRGYDVAVSAMDWRTIGWLEPKPGEEKQSQKALDFDMHPRDPNWMNGEAGIVLAYMTSQGSYARRAYASRISPPLTAKVREQAGVQPAQEHMKYFKDSFRWIILPPGHARPLRPGDENVIASGTSGAACIGWNPSVSEPEMSGIIAAAAVVKVGSVTYDLAEVLDREFIRETIQHAIGPRSGPSRFAEPRISR